MIPTIFLVATLFQSIAYTTWWSTEGAKVIQVPGQNLCTLYISQQNGSVGFVWERTALAGIVFQDDDWDFPPRQTKAAVRIDSTWVSGNADIDWFEATENKDEIIVPIRYFPVESLLSNAGSVSLHREGAELNVALNKAKMPKLLDAVQDCRRHLK